MTESLLKSSPSYPANLLEIDDCPSELFVKGKLSVEDRLAVAIVGTRNMTQYGEEITKKFTSVLARAGVTIISGLARGVDTVAHITALKNNGRTIAVLGSGLDIIYPPENRELATKIIQNGALISQFKDGTKPYGKNFLARNRIIAGLSKAIIVIEGTQRSGTLSTATHAANIGREVFAVPGPVNSPQSQAPLYLIENGAQVARSPENILEFLNQFRCN